MKEFLAVLSGIIIAVMIAMNSALSQSIGNYHATVFIHFTGLVLIVLMLILTKNKLNYIKGLPLYLYSGGVIGVFTTVANIVTTVNLSVSLTLALGIFGQLATSVIIDFFGLFSVEKQALDLYKILGLSIIAAGIACMLLL